MTKSIAIASRDFRLTVALARARRRSEVRQRRDCIEPCWWLSTSTGGRRAATSTVMECGRQLMAEEEAAAAVVEDQVDAGDNERTSTTTGPRWTNYDLCASRSLTKCSNRLYWQEQRDWSQESKTSGKLENGQLLNVIRLLFAHSVNASLLAVCIGLTSFSLYIRTRVCVSALR